MMTRIVVIGSMTSAQRARRILSAQGFRVRLTKTESAVRGGGCVYGLEVAEGDLHGACTALRAGGIEYRLL